jgi:NAD(P)-dependent dehydrogenase (short-subunit alcohol dehydrogenase family)
MTPTAAHVDLASPTGPPLDGAVALVSGAAGGIGAALVDVLLARGVAVVVATDVDGAGLDALVRARPAAGERLVTQVLDATDRDDVVDAVAAVAARFGPVDVCCANAGTGTLAGVLDGTPSAWQRAWDVNVMGQVHLAAAVLPGMLERGRGGLVLTASAAGLLSLPGDAPYAVTKHASVALAEWLALTHGPQGIAVAALCPLGVATGMLETDGLATRFVRASAELLDPAVVAEVALDALARGDLLALPHPEVVAMEAARIADRPAWLARMRAAVVRLGG